MDFAELKTEVAADWEAQGEYRRAMVDDFAFRDGHQWTDAEKAALEDQNRAPVVFNRVATILASVTGSEINNRTEVQFIPREMGDVKPNEVLTAGAQWFRDCADAEDEESQAFDDLLVCGIGWTETWLDFEEDEEGQPETERVDPREMGWDRHSHRKGLQDAARRFRVRDIPEAEAKEMFPGKSLEEIHCGWLSRGSDGVHENIIPDQYASGQLDSGRPTGLVTVVQCQYRVRNRVVEYVDTVTGKKGETTEAKWRETADKLASIGAEVGFEHRTVTRVEWRQCFMGAADFLKESTPCRKHPTFQCMTGHWDAKAKRFYGLLQSMRDPQKYANKWLSQTLHIINANAKGGVLMEEDAVADIRDFEESWAAADAISWTRPGSLTSGKVQPKPQAQMPVALMQLTEMAVNSIRDVSGVNYELQGLAEQQQAGVLEYQRRQASMATLGHYFDALRFYRKNQGHVILYFLVVHIAPTGRLVRVVEEDMVQYVPLVADPNVLKYDVIVDDAPSAPNEKERVWSIMQTLLPMIADRVPPDLMIEALAYAPLPSSFVDKMREAAQKAAQQPPPPEQQAMLEKTQSETEENRSQVMLNQAKAQETMAEAMIKPQKAMYEAETNRMAKMEAARHAGTAQETARFSAVHKAQHDSRSLAQKGETDRMNALARASGAPRNGAS